MSCGNTQPDGRGAAARCSHEDVGALGSLLLTKYGENRTFSLFSGNSQRDGHHICYLSVYNPVTEQDTLYFLTRTTYGLIIPWVRGCYPTLGAVFVPLLRQRKLRLLLDNEK